MSVMVITGGTAGAGKATALRFARAGYHVALIAEMRRVCRKPSRPANGLALKRWPLAPTSPMPGRCSAPPPRWKPHLAR